MKEAVTVALATRGWVPEPWYTSMGANAIPMLATPQRCSEAAHAAGRRIAFTLSDSFCVSRHKGDFLRLIDENKIDILFANQAEIEEMAGIANFDEAVAAFAARVPTLVVTRSEHGAIAVRGAERGATPFAGQQVWISHALAAQRDDGAGAPPAVAGFRG